MQQQAAPAPSGASSSPAVPQSLFLGDDACAYRDASAAPLWQGALLVGPAQAPASRGRAKAAPVEKLVVVCAHRTYVVAPAVKKAPVTLKYKRAADRHKADVLGSALCFKGPGVWSAVRAIRTAARALRCGAPEPQHVAIAFSSPHPESTIADEYTLRPWEGVAEAYSAWCAYHGVAEQPLFATYIEQLLAHRTGPAVLDLSRCPGVESGLACSADLACSVLALAGDTAFRALVSRGVVCDRLFEAVGTALRSNRALTKVCVEGTGPAEQDLRPLAASLPASLVQVLSFANCRLSSSSFTDFCFSLSTIARPLISLNFYGCKLSSKSCVGLFKALGANATLGESLQHIDVGGNRIEHTGTAAAAAWFAANPGRLSLRSFHAPGASLDLGTLLPRLQSAAPCLTSLDISGNALDASAARALAECAPKMLQLSRLCLSDCSLSHESLDRVLASLASNHNGLYLDLSRNALNPAGVAALCAAAASGALAGLAHLDVSACRLTSKHVCELVAALRGRESLRSLFVGHNMSASDRELPEAVAALVSLLSSSATLCALSVQARASPLQRALHPLLEAVGDNQRITYLDVSGNALGDAGMSVLAKSLKKNTSLVELSVDCNKVGINGFLALAMVLPANRTLQHLPFPHFDEAALLSTLPLPPAPQRERLRSTMETIRYCLRKNYHYKRDNKFDPHMGIPDLDAPLVPALDRPADYSLASASSSKRSAAFTSLDVRVADALQRQTRDASQPATSRSAAATPCASPLGAQPQQRPAPASAQTRWKAGVVLSPQRMMSTCVTVSRSVPETSMRSRSSSSTPSRQEGVAASPKRLSDIDSGPAAATGSPSSTQPATHALPVQPQAVQLQFHALSPMPLHSALANPSARKHSGGAVSLMSLASVTPRRIASSRDMRAHTPDPPPYSSTPRGKRPRDAREQSGGSAAAVALLSLSGQAGSAGAAAGSPPSPRSSDDVTTAVMLSPKDATVSLLPVVRAPVIGLKLSHGAADAEASVAPVTADEVEGSATTPMSARRASQMAAGALRPSAQVSLADLPVPLSAGLKSSSLMAPALEGSSRLDLLQAKQKLASAEDSGGGRARVPAARSSDDIQSLRDAVSTLPPPQGSMLEDLQALRDAAWSLGGPSSSTAVAPAPAAPRERNASAGSSDLQDLMAAASQLEQVTVTSVKVGLDRADLSRPVTSGLFPAAMDMLLAANRASDDKAALLRSLTPPGVGTADEDTGGASAAAARAAHSFDDEEDDGARFPEIDDARRSVMLLPAQLRDERLRGGLAGPARKELSADAVLLKPPTRSLRLRAPTLMALRTRVSPPPREAVSDEEEDGTSADTSSASVSSDEGEPGGGGGGLGHLRRKSSKSSKRSSKRLSRDADVAELRAALAALSARVPKDPR
eukprot:m51a1_g14579 hypothetical protein (1397) ;mRNA; r:1110358-1115808